MLAASYVPDSKFKNIWQRCFLYFSQNFVEFARVRFFRLCLSLVSARVRVYVGTPCRVVLTRHAGARCPNCARAADDADEIRRCAEVYIVVVDGERRRKDGKLCFTFSFIF